MLRAATHERHDLRRTEKTMSVNESDDVTITLRQLHGSNRGSAFEAGKTRLHRSTLSDTTQTEKASRFALGGKCECSCSKTWRRGSESNGVFTDCQPQYPDLQGYFNTGFTGLQAVFITIRHLPDLTRQIPAAYSVIEEIVEGFVEEFFGLR
jgi:hypothetical protein